MRCFAKSKSGQRAQAVAELAIFGGLVLFIFGTVLSYIQRSNDQQYVQMEAFRRALKKACSFQGEDSEGAGASVQMTLMQNRRHADLSGDFRKGSPQSFSASSNVFWAVPKSGSQPENLIAYRVNQDELVIDKAKYDTFVTDSDQSFGFDSPTSETNSTFNESTIKAEDTQGITNTRSSRLSETITTHLPYKVTKDDGDDNPDNDPVQKQGEFVFEQKLYRGSNGQYRYSNSSVIPDGYVVERNSTWQTPF